MAPLFVLLAALAAGDAPALTFEGASRHPTVNVTPADVERARRRVAFDPEAKAWLEGVHKSVTTWSDKDPAWIRSVMPGEGACFAYGFTGCPICSGRWSAWGKARCSFDKPGKVTCSGGHVLPDAEHPDPGTGYKAPDGRIHYFVGSYNAWAVETLIFKIAKPYTTLWLLDRDDRAGRMATVILDEIARIYPSCDKGSWDYPSNPPSGRLCRPWYQVARVLVHFVDMYDKLYDHPAMDEPSSRSGLTRRQNIENNLLLNGAKYCYDMSIKQGGLHNGQADYLRGVLAVGVVLGIPEYVTWPVDGTYGIRAMLANNVDRDGRYFETASGYALHTRNLYLTFSEPLLNYRGSAYPNGLNLYDDPRFEAFYVLPQMATTCLGHWGTFGDASPAFRTRTTPPYHPRDVWDIRYAEHLAVRMSDPAKRAAHQTLLEELKRRDPDHKKRLADMTAWRIFHGPDEPATGGELTERMEDHLDGSFFVGQKGLAVLRQGSGPAAHAAILRFGPSLVHGHYDDLNVNYYAAGYDISYDLGYSLGSTHTQVGWAKQTISHNVVVVDETSHGGGQFGGSLLHFADTPNMKLAEGTSNVYAHAGVKTYRRLFAVTDGYALDVFRVRGGKQHDLPMHSISTEVTWEGLAFGEPQEGSLAGQEYRWGALQLNDGDMKGYPGKPYWNPPPGNGYGFLVEPAWAEPSNSWRATWHMQDKAKTRFELLALHTPGTRVVSAVAPGLYPTYPKARYLIRRRKGDDLSSCFVSVWQAWSGKTKPAVRSIRRIDEGGAPTADSAMILRVDLNDGRRDVWCLSPSADMTVSGKDGDTEISLSGSIGWVRMKGDDVEVAHVLDARKLSVGKWTIELGTASRLGVVAAEPAHPQILPLDRAWPADGRYDGEPVYVSRSSYSPNSAYLVDRIDGRSRLVVQQAGTILGQGTVAEVKDANTLITKVPHEYARSVRRRGPSGFFRGKWLDVIGEKTATHIRSVTFGRAGTMTIDVESTRGLKPGQRFLYRDVQPGDTVTVQHWASLRRQADGRHKLNSNTQARAVTPADKTIP